jgi:hypothetical protein
MFWVNVQDKCSGLVAESGDLGSTDPTELQDVLTHADVSGEYQLILGKTDERWQLREF